MLTDEEINIFWFTLGGDFVSFARDIERAVLAKAGEQEPAFAFMGGYTMIEGKKYYDMTVNYKFKDNLPKGNFYAHPRPAQAIPEGYTLAPVEPTPEMLDAGVAMALQVSVHGEGGWSKYLAGLYKQMLSASPKP